MNHLAKSVAYKALDLVTRRRGVRRWIAGETFRMPARWSRYYPGDYELATFEFLREWCRPGDTVMDAGSHLGLFTVCMSRLVGPSGRVLAYEPTPHTCAVLRETVRINHCESNVLVQNKAVAKGQGCASFFETGDVVSNANSLVRNKRSKREIAVETVSIDQEVPPGRNVRLLKIDVEGAELDVLRGACRTLASSRPLVHLSLHPAQIRENGGTMEEVWDLLRDFRMEVFHDRKIVPRPWFRDREELLDVQALPST
ncbi:MAG TPA: FkbM family methyltransferase [Isosphaeraceae bacterium]|jgi:FkbM family methyltransferase|nr:FkbM family methyltransferase [Isosphaeraceae bacterium]